MRKMILILIKSFLPLLQAIQGAIDEFQKKNETFKLASKELNVEEPVSLM